ncbi:MAG: ATP cone domain-containing protein [Patescibacteria group bacterium]
MSDTPVKNKYNVFHIIKRSGDAVLFDEEKLRDSINKALRAVHIQEQPISNQIVDDVIDKLGEELSYREHISTLDVREAVEIALLERGLTKAAGAYHDFVSTPSVKSEQEDIKDAKEEPVPVVKEPKPKPQQQTETTKVAKEDKQEEVHSIAAQNTAIKKKLAEERHSVTYTFTLHGCRGYITVSLFDDGAPGEITLHSLYDTEGRDVRIVHFFLSVVSAGLQYGVPLQALLDEIVQAQDQMTLLEDEEFGYELLRHITNWLSNKF